MIRHALDFRRAVCACALLAVFATAAPADAKVRIVHRGPAVRLVQQKVHAAVDGVYGPASARAVRAWQKAHGLHADGIVGPATWASFGITANKPIVRRLVKRKRAGTKAHRASRSSPTRHGSRPRVVSRGREVMIAQRRLHIVADGVFGPGTAQAVKAFQRAHGLTADGIVGPATWTALGLDGSAHPVLKRGPLHGGAPGIPAAIGRAIAAANRIATTPYRYGGGHASFNDTGYDCSGSVSYVLHFAGKLRSPLDSGSLMSWGLPGPGRYITVYANGGHAYMTIRGRRYDTSARYLNGSRWTNQQRSSAGYVVRHPPGL